MKPVGYTLNLKRLRLIITLILSSLIYGNLGSLDFFKASSSTCGSHMIDLNDPIPQPSNLINPSLSEGVLETLLSKRLKNQESNTGPLRIANFDLNEIPEDTGSEVNHNHEEHRSELESERHYGQTSKSQMIDPAHRTLSPVDTKFSSAVIGYVSTKPTSDHDQRINESKFVRDVTDSYSKNQVPKNQPKRRYDQKDKNQNSFKILKEKDTNSSKKILTKYGAQSRKRKKSDGSGEQYLFSEIKRKNMMMLSSAEKLKHKIYKNLNAYYLKSFKSLLMAKVKNTGPFDIQGENTYRSPYNRSLLGFIENNLENILPRELNKYKINNDFLKMIKKFFWNEEEGLFFLSEESFKEAVISLDSRSHSACSQRWIISSNSGSSKSKFSFSNVFAKFLTYDKLSRFFLNDEMRQIGYAKFAELNSKLQELTKGDIHIRRGVHAKIMRQTWNRMTSFLAYVHAINAIISPCHSKPLSYEQLVKHQEGAIDFFFQLHDNVEILCLESSDKKFRNIKLKRLTDKLDIEEEKRMAMKEIFRSHLRSDNASWLYIELWMIKCRPSLYEIMKHSSGGEIKFRSLANRVFLIMFSGMYSCTKCIESKKPIS
ncbi:hypothetical protein BY996DRAFT_3436819 [Phakopsora pachyrhizi]|uniref:Expressed protein n=1 Tax=Phakopsora pachyrhizi TaxID=170000 RepID=A0AAV0AP96_PHAPC|nr:hypothetical protein BY996DRAFT_3436819 [Phakopsora pachyrhizi]CAH7670026.1 expressed protein [Phakopsora pachyrhizi]CAH7670059.1 expressed protein [Phakopsora pachyrhizi]